MSLLFCNYSTYLTTHINLYNYNVLFFLFIVIVEITSHPMSVVEYVNTTASLSCEATGSVPISYQWGRVNGEISSERATGVNTPTLTISPVREEDEDEYYCMVSNGGVDGMRYSDTSQKAEVTVFGKIVLKLFIY